MKRQASSAKLSNRSYGSCMGISPYEKNYRGCLRADQRELIFEHQRVAKMPRRDLEDLYINLCDDHYALKREHRFNQEKIKRLITKVLRLSSISLSDVRANLNPNLVNKPRDALSFEERLQICIFDLEIQNSQLRERLQVLCKRHGLAQPSRPASEMYTNPFHSSDLHYNRARSCHHLNRVGQSVEETNSSNLPLHQQLPLDTVPVKSEDNRVAEANQKIKELEEKNEKLGRLLAEFNEELEKERNHNKDLVYKLKELDLRKHISENIELIHLKEKLDKTKNELRKRIEVLENTKERNEKNLQDEQKKMAEMGQKLKDEEEKAKKLLQQSKQIEGFKRQIEDLREKLIESDSEKTILKTQHERFALLLKESVHQEDRIQILKDKNILLQTQLDEAKTNEMAVLHTKAELVEKIINIQNENDRISIELEGLKSRSKFLNQENEYLTTEVSTLKVIESKRDIREEHNSKSIKPDSNDNSKADTKGSSKVPSPTNSPYKTIGVNTEPISVLKETDRQYLLQTDTTISEHNKDDLPSEHSLTIDSERSLLSYKQSTSKNSPKQGAQTKNQTNHLELLERAALYRPYLGSEYSKLKFDLPETENSITESLSVDYGLSITEPGPSSQSSSIVLHLKSFNFHESPSTSSSFHLEVTLSPGQSFHTPSKRHRNGCISFDYPNQIELNEAFLQSLKNPDHPIRFLLIERKPATNKSEIGAQSSSSSAHDDTFRDIVQCQEIAFGSLKYAALIKSMPTIDTIGKSRGSAESFEVPFSGTQFAHPEIGRLTLRCMIDDVERIRQLLTNTKPSSV